MTKKQTMNRIYVACWEFYKKYHAMAPLAEEQIDMMCEESMQIAEQYGHTLFVRRLLYATCDELCNEKENNDG